MLQILRIHLNDYGGPPQQFSHDIALVELESEIQITSTTMPICVDWDSSQRPLRNRDTCLVRIYGASRTPTKLFTMFLGRFKLINKGLFWIACKYDCTWINLSVSFMETKFKSKMVFYVILFFFLDESAEYCLFCESLKCFDFRAPPPS